MKIQFCHFLFVDEHHGIALIKCHQQRYLVTVSFHGKTYRLSAITHEKNNYCLLCRSAAKAHAVCYYFLLHYEDVKQMEQVIEESIKMTIQSVAPFQLVRGKSAETKAHQNQIIALNTLAISRKETIEAYGSTFDYYSTIKERKKIYVLLNGKERKTKPKGTHLLNKKQIEQLLANCIPYPNVLHQQEEAIEAQYDVQATKWMKLTYLIKVIEKSVLLYNDAHKHVSLETLQDFIVYLCEVLYREIPIHAKDKEHLLRKHQQIMSVIQLYIVKSIQLDDCLHQLIKDPHDYLAERKERVMFTIKALLKSKEVFSLLQKTHPEQAELWKREMGISLLRYLKIELGVSFKSKDEQQLLEAQICDAFIHFQQEKWQEKQLFHEIELIAPFSQETFNETINRFLQKINKRKPQYVFYLMEVDMVGGVNESIAHHIAYEGLEEIKMKSTSLLYGEHYALLRWMTEEEAYTLRNLLKKWEIESNEIQMWEVKNERYTHVDEYILYNGERIYRLHFRKR